MNAKGRHPKARNRRVESKPNSNKVNPSSSHLKQTDPPKKSIPQESQVVKTDHCALSDQTTSTSIPITAPDVYSLYQQNLQQLAEYYKIQNVAEQYNRLFLENLMHPKFQHSFACLESTHNMLRGVSLSDGIENNNSLPLSEEPGSQCVVCRWLHMQSKLGPSRPAVREDLAARQAMSRSMGEYVGEQSENFDLSPFHKKPDIASAASASGDPWKPAEPRMKAKFQSQAKSAVGLQGPIIIDTPSGDFPVMLTNNVHLPSPFYVTAPPPPLPQSAYYQPTILKSIPAEAAPVFGHCLIIGQPEITLENTFTLLVNQYVKVEMTADHSIRVTSLANPIAVAINCNGIISGLHHPSGSVFQDGPVINVEVGSKKAKISQRGITFTSQNRSLVYIVDKSGCKTTTERYRKINYDFTTDVFQHNAMSGEHARQRIVADVTNYSHETLDGGKGDEVWQISGVRIRKKPWGDVIITRCFGRYMISMSPTTGETKLVTPLVKVFVNEQSDKYFQVLSTDPNNGTERKITVCSNKFRVKNGSQQAGFDAKDQLVLL